MRFKNLEDYKVQRQTAMSEVEGLMNEGKHVEAGAKMADVEKMDNDWNDDRIEMANSEAIRGRFANLSNVRVGGESTQPSPIFNQGAEEAIESLDYRKAFMNYVTKGEKIPSQFVNANENTKTTDVGAVIPNTVLQKIIEKMEIHGQILARVTKTAYKGGVTIPTSTVKPVAVWVAEGAGSDKQKKTTGSITFAYHKLRCAVSVSLETDVMALEVFERTLINNVAEAMVKALEQSILFGSGVGQPKGFLKETVPAGQNVDILAAKDLDLETIEAAEAALPLAYEAGAVWLMDKKTYLKAKTVKGTDGQYIFKETRGVNGGLVRMLNEREVLLTDDMPSITATVESDTIVAALFNLEDYILNTNYSMGIREYYDEETEDKIKKSVMLVDGKVVDINSLVTITKKA